VTSGVQMMALEEQHEARISRSSETKTRGGAPSLVVLAKLMETAC